MNNRSDCMLLAIKAAAMMIENGGETYRAEECCLSILCGCGCESVNVVAFPTVVMATAQIDGEMRTECISIKKRTINLGLIDRVNGVSRRIAAGELNVEDGFAALEKNQQKHPLHPLWISLLAAISAGSFAILFDGGAIDFLYAFVASFLARNIVHQIEKVSSYNFVSTLGGSAVIALVARAAVSISAGSNMEAIIIGAIMSMLPGLAMTNAIRDTINGDLVSGVARGAEALICAVAIAGGVAIVLSI